MGITARLCPFTPSCVQRFLISGGQFKNRCKVMPVYALLCAAIPDFRGSIWESLQGYCPFTPLACSDSLFEGVNLGIAARLCPFTSSCVQRFLISGQDLRIDAAEKSSACSGRSGNEVRVRFYSSLPQRRMVPPVVVVAATRSASDSILRFREGEWFRLQQSLRLRRIVRLQRRRGAPVPAVSTLRDRI